MSDRLPEPTPRDETESEILNRTFGRAFGWAIEQGADEATALELAKLSRDRLPQEARRLVPLINQALAEEAAARMALLSVEDQVDLWLWRCTGVTAEALVGLDPTERIRQLFPYRLFLIRCAAPGIEGQVEYAERMAAFAASRPVSSTTSNAPAGAPCRALGCDPMRHPLCEEKWIGIRDAIKDGKKGRPTQSKVASAVGLTDRYVRGLQAHFGFSSWNHLVAVVLRQVP